MTDEDANAVQNDFRLALDAVIDEEIYLCGCSKIFHVESFYHV